MIVDERMRTYINSLDMGNTPFLEELEQYAIRERVPIIRREMQSFIKMFLAVNRPKRILEVGTAVGFSTLLMCEYSQPEMHITTIENYEKRIPIAKENIKKAGKENAILKKNSTCLFDDDIIAIYLFLLFSLITGNIQNLFTISSIPAYDAFIV